MNLILEKQALPGLLQSWREQFDVYVPQKLERFSHFMPLLDTSVLVTDEPHNTRIPPKALFLPMTETLVKFTRFGGYEDAHQTIHPRIIFGIRPCDAQAVQLLDTSFIQEGYTDPLWLERREKTITIGLGCHEPCHNGFCTTVGYGPFNKADLDALLTDIGDFYLIETLSEAGETCFRGLASASDETYEHALNIQHTAHDQMPVAFETENLKEKLEQNFNSQYWEAVSQSCLGCGVCTFLCPTCWCFDIQDEANHDQGCRLRLWDSCMFPLFTLHGSGHNPRNQKLQRVRQRFMHKLKYYPEKYGSGVACVGCGRCVNHCPVNIDIRQVARLMSATCVCPA